MGCTGVDPITAAPPFCDGPQGITDHVMGIATEGSLKLRAQHRRHRPNGRTSVRDDGLRASPAILSLVRDQHLPEQRLVSEELAEGQRTTRDASGDAQHIPPEPPIRRNGPVFTLGREALFVQRLQRIGRRFSGKRPRGPPARTLRPWEASELGGEAEAAAPRLHDLPTRTHSFAGGHAVPEADPLEFGATPRSAALQMSDRCLVAGSAGRRHDGPVLVGGQAAASAAVEEGRALTSPRC